MSTQPSPSDDYRVSDDDELSAALWNAVHQSIGARLAAVEAAAAGFDAALSPAALAVALALLQNDVIPQLEGTQNQLTALLADLNLAEAKLAVLVAGGIAAGNVTLAAIPGFAPTNAQSAFVDVLARIATAADGVAALDTDIRPLVTENTAGIAALSAKFASAVPIGAVIRSTAFPGEAWMPLDGAKYLRSAYPQISGLYPSLPLSMTATPLAAPAALASIKDVIVCGSWIVATGLRSSDNKPVVVRAPKATAGGGADFTEVTTLGNASTGVTAYLMRTAAGRIYAVQASSNATAGAYRSSDDDGASWSPEFPIAAGAQIGAVQTVFEYGNRLYFTGGGGIYRTTDNAAAFTLIAPGFDWVRRGNALYRNVSGQIKKLDLATEAVSDWANIGLIAGDNGGPLCLYSGDIIAARHIADAGSGSGLRLWRIAPTKALEVIAEVVIEPGASSLGDITVITAPDGAEIIAARLISAGPPVTTTILFIDPWTGGVSRFTAGTAVDSTRTALTASGSTLCSILGTNAVKWTLDIDQTEFRLPYRPAHYVKVTA